MSKILNLVSDFESAKAQVINQNSHILDMDGRLNDTLGLLPNGYHLPELIDNKLAYLKEGKEAMLCTTLMETTCKIWGVFTIDGYERDYDTFLMPIHSGNVKVKDDCNVEHYDMIKCYSYNIETIVESLIDMGVYVCCHLSDKQKKMLESEIARIKRFAAAIFPMSELSINSLSSLILNTLVVIAFLRRFDSMFIPNEEEEDFDIDSLDMMMSFANRLSKLDVFKWCELMGMDVDEFMRSYNPDKDDTELHFNISDTDFYAVLGMAEPFFWSMVNNKQED